MIPAFPRFKEIDLTDRHTVERITKKFPPYSDFNFLSLWSWSIKKGMKLSKLNRNLVVLFSDYVTNESHVSFIGNNKILDTTFTLLHFAKEKFNQNFLKLIPEDIVPFYTFAKSPFVIKADRDAADYVYLCEHLAQMDTWRKNSRGESLRHEIKRYPSYKVTLKTPQGIDKQAYHDLFHQWSSHKHRMSAYELNEYKAFERFLKLTSKKIKFISIYIDNTLVGFSAYEILPNHYAIAHFSKANVEHFPGMYDILNWEEARVLSKHGVKFLNWEQDLGIEGLRYSKEKYRPYFLIKKVSVYER